MWRIELLDGNVIECANTECLLAYLNTCSDSAKKIERVGE